MDNLGENLELISEQLAALSAQIAEEKKALGNLWNKVDELKKSSANDIEYLSNQTSEWTQTNLQLMKLLAAKTQETERLAQNSSWLASALNELKTQFAQSQQPMTKLSNFSENLPVLANTKAEILVQQLSSSQPIFAELNMRLKALLKVFLPKSMILDTRKMCEMRRNGEDLDLENLPETIDWGMAQHHFIQQIANAIYAKTYPHIKELKQIKQGENPRGLISIADASPGLAAAVGVSTIGVLALMVLLGVQLGNFQTLSNYRQAIELWDWNQALVEKARSENKQKTSVWVQPPREK